MNRRSQEDHRMHQQQTDPESTESNVRFSEHQEVDGNEHYGHPKRCVTNDRPPMLVPRDFYQSMTTRPDLRTILRRLADS